MPRSNSRPANCGKCRKNGQPADPATGLKKKYGWRWKRGRTPSGSGHQRLNIIGLFNRANEAYVYPHTGSSRSAEVIAVLDHFANARPHRLTLVIMGKAPRHHSAAVARVLNDGWQRAWGPISCHRTASS